MNWWQKTVYEKENVPTHNAAPDEKTLNQCEMAHCECNLAVHCPDDASEHNGAHSSLVSSLASSSEGLIVENDEVKEKDDEGVVETVSNPTEYFEPVEE